LAAQLQAQWGNQAVASLIDLPATKGIAATASEAEEEEQLQLEEEPEQKSDRERGQPAGLVATKGLPTRSGGGGGMSAELQFGGDDDDPLPLPPELEGTPLDFSRSGWGNEARLRIMRERGLLSEAALQQADAALSQARSVGPAGPDAARSMAGRVEGDALFRSPMEAWHDPALLGGRGCSVEELQGLAGPLDGLGRPMLAGAQIARRARSPLSRSLGRLCAAAPGTILPESSGYLAAASRLASLASLALAAEGLHGAALRDRAVHVALEERALEATVAVAGELSETAPPAHRLYRRVVGEAPPLPPGLPPLALGQAPPSDLARRWVTPALSELGQRSPLPAVAPWSPPPPPPIVDASDPASLVDAALRATAPGPELEVEPRVSLALLEPLVASIDRLVAAGGRAQVELAAAGVACRRPRQHDAIIELLQSGYRSFRATALKLLSLRAALVGQVGRELPAAEPELEAIAASLPVLRAELDHTRDQVLARLTASVEQD